MVWSLLGDKMESWKKIKGYENYLISDRGRVYNYKYKKFRKLGNVRGYHQVDLCKNGVMKTLAIHRLVALAFIPNPGNKRTVNHIDGCKTNNHISNLEWNTQKENVQHSWSSGLAKPKKGIKHGMAKLSEDQVLEIRRLHKTGDYSYRALGKMFGVHYSLIGYIVNRKNWQHI